MKKSDRHKRPTSKRPPIPTNFYALLEDRTFRFAREKYEAIREEGIAREGWLSYQVGQVDHYIAWKTRWFVLSRAGRMLYMTDEPNERRIQLKGHIDIGTSCRICKSRDAPEMSIETGTRTYRLKAGSLQERDDWSDVLRPLVLGEEGSELVAAGPNLATDVVYYHVCAPEGVAYRITPNMNDRVRGVRGPEYGDMVPVTNTKDTFVRHKNGYWLPMMSAERTVLTNEDLRPDKWEKATQHYRKISHTLPPVRSPLLASLMSKHMTLRSGSPNRHPKTPRSPRREHSPRRKKLRDPPKNFFDSPAFEQPSPRQPGAKRLEPAVMPEPLHARQASDTSTVCSVYTATTRSGSVDTRMTDETDLTVLEFEEIQWTTSKRISREQDAMTEMLKHMEQQHLDKGGILPAVSSTNDDDDVSRRALQQESNVGLRMRLPSTIPETNGRGSKGSADSGPRSSYGDAHRLSTPRLSAASDDRHSSDGSRKYSHNPGACPTPTPPPTPAPDTARRPTDAADLRAPHGPDPSICLSFETVPPDTPPQQSTPDPTQMGAGGKPPSPRTVARRRWSVKSMNSWAATSNITARGGPTSNRTPTSSPCVRRDGPAECRGL